MPTTLLKRGSVQSCGDGVCRKKITKSRPPVLPKRKLSQIKGNLVDRGSRNKIFTWDLTPEQEVEVMDWMTNKPCNYCGLTSQEINVFHGLDRIDSSITSYNIHNVVQCCSTCNLAKQSMTIEEFMNWVKRVYNYNFKDKV